MGLSTAPITLTLEVRALNPGGAGIFPPEFSAAVTNEFGFFGRTKECSIRASYKMRNEKSVFIVTRGGGGILFLATHPLALTPNPNLL